MTSRDADPAAAFFRRARLEADRYGPDPWVFIRELLQNSRDAGARRITFSVDEGDVNHPYVRVECVDDGSGMSLEHARRFLFRLYASSKEGDRRQAGRFGVGFWSVLRFLPDRISVRSRPSGGPGWGLVIDLLQQCVVEGEPLATVGTFVGLERGWTRAMSDGQLHRRVLDAVRQNGRFLRSPDGRAVEITVDGEAAHAEFSLAPPSSEFTRPRMRGIVALGPAAQVELFSRGLRVRSAAALDDLLARHDSGARMRVAFPSLPEGLAPQALLDSDELQLLLARADARDDRALRRLVDLARLELVRLVNGQLARYRRLSPFEWARHALGSAVRFLARPFPAVMALSLLALVAGAVLGLRAVDETREGPVAAAAPARQAATTTGRRGLPGSRPVPYRDLAASYRGPEVDELTAAEAVWAPVAIRYEPVEASPWLAALAFEEISADGSPGSRQAPGPLPISEARCEPGCLTIDLAFESGPGLLRLPLPTGHVLVANEVQLDGTEMSLDEQVSGFPVLRVSERRSGRLTYRTAPAPGPAASRPRRPALFPNEKAVGSARFARARLLPADLRQAARATLPLSRSERVQRLTEVVRQRVRYDRSAAVAGRHQAARAGGLGLIERTVSIGAGDCDVINALLLALVQQARVPSRLLVGYLGIAGRVRSTPHAWVEYQDDEQNWRVADATARPAAAAATNAAPAAAPPRVALAAAAPAEAAPASAPAAPESAQPEEPLATEEPASTTVAREVPQPATAQEIPPEPAGAPAPTTRAPLRTPEPGGRADLRTPAATAVAAGAAIVGAGIITFFLWRRTRGRRSVRLDDSGDVSRLLRGALKQPKAFRDMPTVFERRLVPLTTGGLISLREASSLNRSGRLFFAAARGPLAERARAQRAAVIDANTPEGRVVAAALGAIDLDRWDDLLARARADEPCAGANQLLEQSGEIWRVLAADGVADDLAVLDLTPLGGFDMEGVGRARRLILVDRASPIWFVARAAREQRPSEGAFALIEQLAVRLRVPNERRSRLLAVGARAALDSFA